jgi:hypothetical protein
MAGHPGATGRDACDPAVAFLIVDRNEMEVSIEYCGM